MKSTSMSIQLDGIKLYAYHGVLPQENKVGAYYLISLQLSTDFSHAAETDNLTHTINYAEVYQLIKEEMKVSSQLLEHVAYRIANRLFCEFKSITQVKIALYKENPPMEAQCSKVGIEVVYER